MTTTVVVHFYAKPGQEDELRRHMLHAVPRLPELPGCHGGSIFYDVDAPSLFVLIEHWDSVDAHKAYIERLEDDGTMTTLEPLLDQPPRRRYLGGVGS